MPDHLFCRFLTKTLALYLLSSVSPTYAEESYQFFIGGSYTFLDLHGGAKGSQYTANLGGYLDPVILDKKTPSAEAGFWQRRSAFSLSAWQIKSWNMNQVRGTSILTNTEGGGKTLVTRFAKSDMPVWLGYEYTRTDEKEYRLRRGANSFRSIANAYNLHKIKVGYYVDDQISLNAGYYEKKKVKTYNLSLYSLFSLSGGQFAGLDLWYDWSNNNKFNAVIVNGIVGEFYAIPEDIREIQATAKFYPSTDLGLYLTYYRYEDKYSDSENVTIAGSYDFNASINLNLSTSKRFADKSPETEYNAYSVKLNYRF